MEEIKIENLTFTYPNMTSPAVEDVSFTVKRGEFVLLCGKSGCGKSTLMRSLKPAITPYGKKSGYIYIDGRKIESLSQREQTEEIGFVSQNPDNQIVCDKVWHELAFGLENLSYSNDEIRARVAETAEFFGIDSWFHKNVSELSGGQKQILNLGAVMVMQPSVLILDEPTSLLDPISAGEFLQAVSKINRELAVTVIISEHRLEEVFPLADNIIVLDEGKVIAAGNPNEAGTALKNTDSDMCAALPTPMRVYYAVEKGGMCPVTLREGRDWLSQMQLTDDISFESMGTSDSETIIELKDIWFRYEREQQDILKGLSLKVHKNEFYSIVGGNGAGKSTALSVVLGILKQYRGKAEIARGSIVAAVPQNPQALFSEKTVIADLEDAASGLKLSLEEKKRRIDFVVEFCELGSVALRHPFDLSGGEQQRAALAMALLKNPDILVLDEPTKGLDAHFKDRLAKLFVKLRKSGVTILMVSHDIEFCAKYADRCGMLFDGQLVSENTPREFFSGKSFYTTAANRMARDFLPKAVLDTDILSALGRDTADKTDDNTSDFELFSDKASNAPNHNGIRSEKASRRLFFKKLFSPSMEFEVCEIQTSKEKISKRMFFAALIALIMIPLTIFFGIYFLGDRKYYFISLLIILETMLPFICIFEGRAPRARELVIISVLCGLTVASRMVFAPFQQFKPVTALVIISGICFGGETGFLVGAVTAFVSNFFFAQGPWTPWQMFALGIIGFLAGLFFQKGILRKTRLELCVFGFLATLIVYGGIMNFSSVVSAQTTPNIAMLLSVYAAGFPFDLIHAAATAFFLWIAAGPISEKLERVKTKYGLIRPQ